MQDTSQDDKSFSLASLKAENAELKAENIELKAANRTLTERCEQLARLVLELQETVKQLKDEINRLKGQKSRPKFPAANLGKDGKGDGNKKKQAGFHCFSQGRFQKKQASGDHHCSTKRS